MILNCFKCDKGLESVFPDSDFETQPYKGTTFISYGQYGSTVFDPMRNVYFLEMNICDECLVNNKDKVLHCTKEVDVKYHYEEWNPEK